MTPAWKDVRLFTFKCFAPGDLVGAVLGRVIMDNHLMAVDFTKLSPCVQLFAGRIQIDAPLNQGVSK